MEEVLEVQETLETPIESPVDNSVNISYEELLSTTKHIEELIVEQNGLVNGVHVSLLFIIGTVSSVFVLFLLYKFIKLFY